MDIIALEVAWTMVATLGMVTSLYNYWDVLTEQRVLRRSGKNGMRNIAIKGGLRVERVFLTACILFWLIGVMALINPNPEADNVGLLDWVFRAALIGTNVMVTYGSVGSRLTRNQLFGYAEEVERKASETDRKATQAHLQSIDVAASETAATLVRMEANDATVASDLQDRQDRADDAKGGLPGESADAALRSPEEG